VDDVPSESVDPLVLIISESNFTGVESHGDFAAVIQCGEAKV
jgi:hypothetical protein